MSNDDLKYFRKLVLRSFDLQEQLKMSANEQEFIELAVKLGNEEGYFFSEDELSDFLESQRQQEAEMTVTEKLLAQVIRFPSDDPYWWSRRPNVPRWRRLNQ